MNRRSQVLIVACSLALGALGQHAAATSQGVGPGWYAEVTWAHEGTGPLSLYNLPDGTGHSFSEAFEFGTGNTVDATISLTIHDGFDRPLANFPAEDIWLRSADYGMVSC
ncbi:hypothetical protein DRQ50_13560, partial [bacterium]